MSLELELSEPHQQMLQALREEHGVGIDEHLRARAEAEIHESFQQLRVPSEPS
jgi:hypothetical protein